MNRLEACKLWDGMNNAQVVQWIIESDNREAARWYARSLRARGFGGKYLDALLDAAERNHGVRDAKIRFLALAKYRA